MKILGEDFIAFRDGDGRAGVIDPRCPHRGANLFFGEATYTGFGQLENNSNLYLSARYQF